MSGTQDANCAAQISESGGALQPGAADVGEKTLSSSERMNEYIRSHSSPKRMQKEIDKVRAESAKLRSINKDESSKREMVEQEVSKVKADFEELQTKYRSLEIMRVLDKAGCIKSELVAKDVPADCKDFSEFVQKYKEENPFLFSVKKQSLGGAFKPSKTVNLTPSQKMDRFIRSSLGR